MDGVMTQIIGLLTDGITGIAEGIGTGLSTLAQSVFLVEGTSGAELSTFGGLVVIFAGLSLAIGLSRWVVSFVTSLGARNS